MRDYLFPLEVMGALFRSKVLAMLDTAIAHGEILRIVSGCRVSACAPIVLVTERRTAPS